MRLASTHGWDLSRVVYVGNDINDLSAMTACGVSVCPADAHPLVLSAASVRLATPGGFGVVRELLEDVLEVDLVKCLYGK